MSKETPATNSKSWSSSKVEEALLPLELFGNLLSDKKYKQLVIDTEHILHSLSVFPSIQDAPSRNQTLELSILYIRPVPVDPHNSIDRPDLIP
jgi:hypothetical protein